MKALYSTILFIGSYGLTSVAVSAKEPKALTPVWTATPSQSGYYINSVATSSEGGRVVGGTFFHSYGQTGTDSSTGKFGTYCYNRDGTLRWKDEFTGWQGVYWVDISGSGAWAASGGWYSQNPDHGFVRAYATESGKTVLSVLTDARVNQVALSGDGEWLVAAADTLLLFERVDGKYQQVDEFKAAAKSDTMETIGLSADGHRLVVGDYAGSIMLFSIAKGKFGTPKTWALPSGGYSHSVRINHSGRAFAAGGSDGDFYLFDTADFLSTGQPTVTYQVPNAGSVYGVAISHDGEAFIGIANATSDTGAVYYVERHGHTGKLKWTFLTKHNPNSVSLNSEARLVAVADGHPDGSPGDFYVLNATTGKLKGEYGTSNMSWPIQIDDTGSAIVAGSDDSKIYYFASPKSHTHAVTP